MRALLVSAAVVVAAPLLSLAASLLLLRTAFRSTDVADPAQKARLLAEGISESMNAVACGIVISLVAMVPTVIFAVRVYREPKHGKPSV